MSREPAPRDGGAGGALTYRGLGDGVRRPGAPGGIRPTLPARRAGRRRDPAAAGQAGFGRLSGLIRVNPVKKNKKNYEADPGGFTICD